MNIILFGFKKCGKTYFGKRLAEKMNRRFIDTDTLIREHYKENAVQIYRFPLKDPDTAKRCLKFEPEVADSEAAEFDKSNDPSGTRIEDCRIAAETDSSVCFGLKTIREIYKEVGELKFRAWEHEAIHTLGDVRDSVIALGGGAVLDPENVTFLESIGELAYLQANPETLQKRIFRSDLPAFLDEADPVASFLALYRERIPIYESIQAHRINTDILDEAGVLAALRNILIFGEQSDGF